MLVSSEILFYGLTLISISLSFLVIALVILFVRSIASYHKLKEEKDKLQANAVQLSQQILEEAQSKSEKIIVEARTKAAEILSTAPGALHLRTLQSINDVSSDASNTIIFTIPLEILRAFEKKV